MMFTKEANVNFIPPQFLFSTNYLQETGTLLSSIYMNVSDPSATHMPNHLADTSPDLPPDLVVVVVTLIFFQFLEVIHRRKIARFFKAYSELPYRDRFDWDRRALNLFFQLVQFPFNAYLLLYDSSVTADCLYGYSIVAHLGFLIIIAFYIYDTAGMVMHPRPPSTTPWWILHHLVAVGLLLFTVSYRQTSAFPAATFLISAVGHVPNELRWLSIAMNLNDRRIVNANNVVSAVIVLVSCGLPPPFLLYRSAQQLQVSLWHLVTAKMQPYCIFFFSLIYLPHVGLTVHEFLRAYTQWNKLPGPFRATKID